MGNQYGLTGRHVFITGGAGFIATTLAGKLADDNRITLYDNLHNDALKNSPLRHHSNVRLVKGDVLDAAGLAAAVAPDVTHIVHCAAIAGVGTVLQDPVRTLKVNIQGVFNILDAATNLKKLERFVDFSTSEVFGRSAYNVREDNISPTVRVGEARWTYSISKLAGEFIAHSYHSMKHIPTVTVRPFNIYGPNQVGIGAIRQFTLKAIRGEDLIVHNDGTQIRAWCFVEDFVHGVLLGLTKPQAIGKSYNIGNPRSVLTTLALAQLIIRTAGSASKILFQPLEYTDVEVRTPDITLARKDLNYEPVVEMEEGIERTVAWYREQERLAAKVAA
jgi:nucleoside-diphosphate-sugar epimerase